MQRREVGGLVDEAAIIFYYVSPGDVINHCCLLELSYGNNNTKYGLEILQSPPQPLIVNHLHMNIRREGAECSLSGE